jgi:hypothetical protein
MEADNTLICKEQVNKRPKAEALGLLFVFRNYGAGRANAFNFPINSGVC